MTATSGGLAIGGDVYGDIYQGAPTDDPEEALNIYRQILFQSSGDVALRGIDLESGDAARKQQPLGLANVFISLDTTAAVGTPEDDRLGDGGSIELNPSDHFKELQAGIVYKGFDWQPLSALAAVAQTPYLVLLGDPGSGKSTVVSYLTHCLAGASLEEGQVLADRLPQWAHGPQISLPVTVILRDFAASLPEQLPIDAEPDHLWQFIEARLKAQHLAFAAEPIRTELEVGHCLVMLDGLDEVGGANKRLFVRDAVRAFQERYPNNQYLVTCRTLSYQPPLGDETEPDLLLPEPFRSYEIAPFSEEKIDDFITGWYSELVRLGTVKTTEEPDLTKALKRAVRRPDLWPLAPNPLLLTVMALVHTHRWGRLPDARALLYEETIDILLWRWEQPKVGTVDDHPHLSQLMIEAGRTEMDLKKVLWQLAFEAHQNVRADDGDEGLADIGELRLQKALAALNGDDRTWATQVIETMKLRAGLLLERAPEVFRFPHRTFQEYLAGAYLSTQPGFAAWATALAREGDRYRQVILLAVGRLIYQTGDTDRPLTLVSELCPAAAGSNEASWRLAWLAGEVLVEIGPPRVRDSNAGRDLLKRVQDRLARLLGEGHLTPRERVSVGTVLARLGDPRPGVGLREGGLPDIDWCTVPEGDFLMGEGHEQHIVTLATYQISRYIVTNAQFEAFVQDGGYTEKWRYCWTEAGWADKGSSTGPLKYGGIFDQGNHPVVGITWYEAVAFCQWLTEKMQAVQLISAGQTIRLPTERQWEKAARGLDGQTYPWGDVMDPEYVNYRGTGLETTSPVGTFPLGNSSYGCTDMTGNVWEWCLTKWHKDYEDYPNDNDLVGDAVRVLRGGAFRHDKRNLRCAARGSDAPRRLLRPSGFRIVLSPFPSES